MQRVVWSSILRMTKMNLLNLFALVFCSVAFGVSLATGSYWIALMDLFLVAINCYFVKNQLDKVA